jgi:hypothetical protein
MSAARYTAQGRRDAEARRAAQLVERRKHIASLTLDEFLEDVVGYANASAVRADLREGYAHEWQGCRDEFPELAVA